MYNEEWFLGFKNNLKGYSNEILEKEYVRISNVQSVLQQKCAEMIKEELETRKEMLKKGINEEH